MAHDKSEQPMFGTLLASRPRRNVKGAVTSTVGSLVVHTVVIGGLVALTMRAAAAPPKEDIQLLSLATPEPVLETPPPPDVAPPPEAPATAEPVMRGFQTFQAPDVVPPNIPPPQVGVTITARDFEPIGKPGGSPDGDSTSNRPADLVASQTFVVTTHLPQLMNKDEVERAVSRVYPSILRDAGVTGRTKVRLLVGEDGRVKASEIETPSGYDQFDRAALQIGPTYKFRPAMNMEKKVAVWVKFDVVFQIR